MKEAAEARPVVKLGKRIVPFEESDPASEPLFMNFSQVSHAGGSYYIDVGVIPLDELLSPEQGDVTFLVLNRLVMSRETLTGMAEKIQTLLSDPDKRTRTVQVGTD